MVFISRASLCVCGGENESPGLGNLPASRKLQMGQDVDESSFMRVLDMVKESGVHTCRATKTTNYETLLFSTYSTLGRILLEVLTKFY